MPALKDSDHDLSLFLGAVESEKESAELLSVLQEL